jgi:O-antigen/teichoic acid export membrane protein
LLAELNATGRQRQLERLVRSSTGIVGIPSVALLALFASLGAPVLGTVFGPFYERGAEVLAICSLAQCLFVLAGPCGMALLMTGHQRATVVLALITGVLSISGDIWAAPRFGAVGVAVATSSALILTNVAAVLLVKRWIGIWTIARFSVSDARAAFRAIGSMRGSERAARD